MKGTIINIQRFAIHDGPGIRTTVFMKGCPLHCWWCHNPESQSFKPEYAYDPLKCIVCGDCVLSCSEQANHFEDRLVHNYENCSLCGDCAGNCPTNAIEIIGRELSVQSVMETIEKDRIFFEESGGGVTITGGEPLSQPEFTLSLLKELKRNEIHTALDTTGFAEDHIIDSVVPFTDLFLFDLKHMDDRAHQILTGVSNKKILDHLRRLSGRDNDIWIRFPVIPGYNTEMENIEAMGRFMLENGLHEIFLLPYHNISSDKYRKIGKVFEHPEVEPPEEKTLEYIKGFLERLGLHVHIGG